MEDVAKALDNFASKYASVDKYYGAPVSADQEFLPPWCSVQVARILRQVMEGVKDKVFTALLMKPPAGGPATIKFTEHLQPLAGIEESVKDIEKAYNQWALAAKLMGTSAASSNDGVTENTAAGAKDAPATIATTMDLRQCDCSGAHTWRQIQATPIPSQSLAPVFFCGCGSSAQITFSICVTMALYVRCVDVDFVEVSVVDAQDFSTLR
jgi:hypothetical protein